MISESLNKRFLPLCIMIISFFIAIFLRFSLLGNPFQSSDNSALATRIILNKGYLWMFKEYYGLMINLVVKVFTAFLTLLGVTITEFWFKFPIALFGTLQIPLTYLFLRKLSCSRIISSFGAGLVSVLPIHVMLSRYLWGYDVIGLFFLTLVFVCLTKFFEKPSKLTAFLFFQVSAFYLISHGYILPFFPAILVGILFLGKAKSSNLIFNLKLNFSLLFSYKYWLIPFSFLLLTAPALRHLLQKKTRLGFYIIFHLKDFIGNTGIFIFGAIIVSFLFLFFLEKERFIRGSFLFLSGFFYLSPLFFGTPHGITVSKDYMMIGIFFLVMLIFYVFDNLLRLERIKLFILTIIFIATFSGTVASIFCQKEGWVSLLVSKGRGGIEDYGIKSAGYIIQKYVPETFEILAMHRNIEPENLFYYFKRKNFAFYDLTLKKSFRVFREYKDKVDVVICDSEQVEKVKRSKIFEERVIFFDDKCVPKLWIFVKGEQVTPIPSLKVKVNQFNKDFNREFSWKISFW